MRDALFSSALPAIGLGHALARVVYVQWVLGVQLVICLALGYLIAKRSERPLLECLLAGFFAGVVPLAGYAVMAAAWRWLPRPGQTPR